MKTEEDEIDCVKFLENVYDLLECSEAEWAHAMVRHLHECPPCGVFLRQLQDLRVLLHAEGADMFDPDDPRIAGIVTLARERKGQQT